MVEQRDHNPLVGGSNPSSAITLNSRRSVSGGPHFSDSGEKMTVVLISKKFYCGLDDTMDLIGL